MRSRTSVPDERGNLRGGEELRGVVNWAATLVRLVGEVAIGIAAIDSFKDFLALDADCVTYLATDSGRDIGEVIDQLCAILASRNAVTTIPRLVYPPSLDEASLTKLQSECATGNSSFFGIAPGFTTDSSRCT